MTEGAVGGANKNCKRDVLDRYMAIAKEEKPLASNRAAFHEYHILDKYEAGIA